MLEERKYEISSCVVFLAIVDAYCAQCGCILTYWKAILRPNPGSERLSKLRAYLINLNLLKHMTLQSPEEYRRP